LHRLSLRVTRPRAAGRFHGLRRRRRRAGALDVRLLDVGLCFETPAVRLSSLRIVGLPPFGDVEIPFADESGSPRSVTVFFGGGGVGKTTVLAAISNTRPGYAVALPAQGNQPPYVVTDWTLGVDDPTRPHHLRIATPTVKLEADEQTELLRRREQAHFDRVAKDGGFVFVAIPSTRWFARQPIAMAAPGRTVARYDVRAPIALDDASRTEMARETKQSLAYAAITAALSRDRGGTAYMRLGDAMARTVDVLVALAAGKAPGVVRRPDGARAVGRIPDEGSPRDRGRRGDRRDRAPAGCCRPGFAARLLAEHAAACSMDRDDDVACRRGERVGARGVRTPAVAARARGSAVLGRGSAGALSTLAGAWMKRNQPRPGEVQAKRIRRCSERRWRSCSGCSCR